jgi:hypothetical protein
MDSHDALQTIKILARVALETDDGCLSAEALADMQRRTLKGIVTVIEKVVTEKVLARTP